MQTAISWPYSEKASMQAGSNYKSETGHIYQQLMRIPQNFHRTNTRTNHSRRCYVGLLCVMELNTKSYNFHSKIITAKNMISVVNLFHHLGPNIHPSAYNIHQSAYNIHHIVHIIYIRVPTIYMRVLSECLS